MCITPHFTLSTHESKLRCLAVGDLLWRACLNLSVVSAKPISSPLTCDAGRLRPIQGQFPGGGAAVDGDLPAPAQTVPHPPPRLVERRAPARCDMRRLVNRQEYSQVVGPVVGHPSSAALSGRRVGVDCRTEPNSGFRVSSNSACRCVRGREADLVSFPGAAVALPGGCACAAHQCQGVLLQRQRAHGGAAAPSCHAHAMSRRSGAMQNPRLRPSAPSRHDRMLLL